MSFSSFLVVVLFFVARLLPHHLVTSPSVPPADAFSPSTLSDPYRLVEFSPNDRHWIRESTLYDLRALHNIHFFDLTNFPNSTYLGSGPGPYSPSSTRSTTSYTYPTILHQQELYSDISKYLSPTSLSEVVEILSENFKTRYFKYEEGAKSSEWLFSNLETFVHSEVPEKRRKLVEIHKVKHSDFEQQSIVFSILGTSSSADFDGENNNKEAKETEREVILGAHIDSISNRKSDAPGADDDATGIAVLVHVFKTILKKTEFEPKRTVRFMAFAGEEGGLLGSHEIAAEYQRTGKTQDVVGMMNFDMCGSRNTSDPKDWCSVVMDYTDPGLTDFTQLLVKGYTRMDSCMHEICGYACSDHASFEYYGMPAAYPDEATISPYYHKPTDVMSHIDFDMVLEFAKLAVGFVVELSMDEL